LSGEDNDLVLVEFGLNLNFDADVGSIDDDVLVPWSGGESLSWVLEPNELTFTGLGV